MFIGRSEEAAVIASLNHDDGDDGCGEARDKHPNGSAARCSSADQIDDAAGSKRGADTVQRLRERLPVLLALLGVDVLSMLRGDQPHVPVRNGGGEAEEQHRHREHDDRVDEHLSAPAGILPTYLLKKRILAAWNLVSTPVV